MKNSKNRKNLVCCHFIYLKIKKKEGSEHSSENEEEVQDMKKKTKELFKNAFCRKMFLDHFLSYLKNKNYITLYEEKFNQLAVIFIDIASGIIFLSHMLFNKQHSNN